MSQDTSFSSNNRQWILITSCSEVPQAFLHLSMASEVSQACFHSDPLYQNNLLVPHSVSSMSPHCVSLTARSRVFLHPGSQAAASPGPAALTLSAV